MIKIIIAALVLLSSFAKDEEYGLKARELDKDSFLFPPICGCKDACKQTSPFGPRTHPIQGVVKNHTGCDIGAPLGTKVYASADGEVLELFKSYPVKKGEGYGNQILIRHKSPQGETFLSKYAHLEKVTVTKNSKVKKGQEIGTVDSTGSSTGHHLHFEIMRCKGDGGEKDDSCQKVDPKDFVDTTRANIACEDLRQKHNVPETTTIDR